MRPTENDLRERMVPRALACVLIYAAVLIVGDRSVEAAGTDQVVDGSNAREADQAPLRSTLGFPSDLVGIERMGWSLVRAGLAWYQRTPPASRVCWGGLVACAGLGYVSEIA